MFNRYWRTYPWGLQLFLFLMMIMTLASFASYLVLALVPKLSGVSFAELTQLTEHSSIKAIRTSLLAQGISHFGMFALPGLLFAITAHPRFRSYLGIRAPGKAIHWLLVTGVMLGLIPVILAGQDWMKQFLHFGPWADELQAANDSTIGAFLRLHGPGDLLLLLGVLAVLPAIGEELIFRGVLLRLLHRKTSRLSLTVPEKTATEPDAQRSMVMPVFFTALLFALIHLSPYSFAFIFIAGCVLALIYFLTGSLLCSIWAHFLFNGTQVLLVYLSGHDNSGLKKTVEEPSLPPALVLTGLAMFVVSFYFLVKNQTPMPADWSDDFKDEPETEARELPQL